MLGNNVTGTGCSTTTPGRGMSALFSVGLLGKSDSNVAGTGCSTTIPGPCITMILLPWLPLGISLSNSSGAACLALDYLVL